MTQQGGVAAKLMLAEIQHKYAKRLGLRAMVVRVSVYSPESIATKHMHACYVTFS